jgi:hypothetical protein
MRRNSHAINGAMRVSEWVSVWVRVNAWVTSEWIYKAMSKYVSEWTLRYKKPPTTHTHTLTHTHAHAHTSHIHIIHTHHKYTYTCTLAHSLTHSLTHSMCVTSLRVKCCTFFTTPKPSTGMHGSALLAHPQHSSSTSSDHSMAQYWTQSLTRAFKSKQWGEWVSEWMGGGGVQKTEK